MTQKKTSKIVPSERITFGITVDARFYATEYEIYSHDIQYTMSNAGSSRYSELGSSPETDSSHSLFVACKNKKLMNQKLLLILVGRSPSSELRFLVKCRFMRERNQSANCAFVEMIGFIKRCSLKHEYLHQVLFHR